MKARLERVSPGGLLERSSREICPKGRAAMASVGGTPWDQICTRVLDRRVRMTDRRVRMTMLNQQNL